MIEVRGYTVRWWYEGVTRYLVEKDGKTVYDGFSETDICERLGFNPFRVSDRREVK